MNQVVLQYTLFCTTGQYRPVSCLITVKDIKHFNAHQREYQKRAIEKICAKRYWTVEDLKKGHYTKIKCRRVEEKA